MKELNVYCKYRLYLMYQNMLSISAWWYQNPNQNTHGVKKVAAKNLKKGHAEKDVKSK